MRKFRATTAAVIAATLAGATAPAAAQIYRPGYGYGYGYDGYGYRHRRNNDAGTVIAGIAAVGVIAAIASAASKNRRDRGYGYGGVDSEREAANVCALSAEQRFGAAARARVNDVYRTRDGYQVRGVVEAGYSGRYYDDRDAGFECSIRYGRVEGVRFDGRY